MLKKILSIILVLIMVSAMPASVMAAEETEADLPEAKTAAVEMPDVELVSAVEPVSASDLTSREKANLPDGAVPAAEFISASDLSGNEVDKATALTVVSINGYWPAVTGYTAQSLLDKISLPSGSHYTISEKKWLCDTEGVFLSASSSFTSGKAYSLLVVLKPDSGYSFSSNVTPRVNGADVYIDKGNSYLATDGTYHLWTKCAYSLTAITSARVNGFVQPQAGQTAGELLAKLSVPSGSHYSIDTTLTGWHKSVSYAGLSSSSVFEAGQQYYLNVWLKADSGYVFAGDGIGMFDGSKTNIDSDYNKSELSDRAQYSICSIDYTVPESTKLITSVNVTGFALPKAGQTAGELLSKLSVPSDSHYKVSISTSNEYYSYWYDASVGRMKSTDVFEAGKEYYLSLRVIADSGYTFSGDGIGTLNGSKQYLENSNDYNCIQSGTSSTVYYLCTIDYTVPQSINKVVINGVERPQAGQTAGELLAKLSVPNDAHYKLYFDPTGTVTACTKWYDCTDGVYLTSEDKFVAGHVYYLWCVIYADSGYAFSGNKIGTFTGAADFVDDGYNYIYNSSTGSTEYFLASIDYTVPQSINKVVINGFEQPKAGQTAGELLAKLSVPNDAHYKLYFDPTGTESARTKWYDYTDNVVLTSEDKFVAGHEYYLWCVIYADSGYAFSGNKIGTFTGAADFVDNYYNYIYNSSTGATEYVLASIEYTVPAPTNVFRLSGDGREATAAAISREMYETAENVVIAGGDDYADALVGVPLATALDAPILLVRKSGLEQNTLEELARLKAKNIYILGGSFAVSEETETRLKSLGYKVERIAGDNRFATAVEIAKKMDDIYNGAKSPSIFFVYSHNYPDALAVSGVAAMKGAPILYIAGNGQLDAATKAYLDGYGMKPDMYIIGGTGVISAAADNNLKPYESDGAVERIFGNNRYETCLAINKEFSGYFGDENLCIATGTNFPDALAGGVLCAAKEAPLVLVDKTLDPVKNKNIVDYIKGYDPDHTYIFGGTFAVSQDIENTVAGLVATIVNIAVKVEE